MQKYNINPKTPNFQSIISPSYGFLYGFKAQKTRFFASCEETGILFKHAWLFSYFITTFFAVPFEYRTMLTPLTGASTRRPSMV